MAVGEKMALEGIELLGSLDDEERARVVSACRWRTYGAGEQVLDRDGTTHDVLFITEGQVRVVNYSASGRETAYAVVSAGGYIGEIAAIDGQERTASVVALKPCSIGALPAKRFRVLVEEHPAVAWMLLNDLSAIIRITNERIAELSTVSAVQRIYRELLRLCEPGADGTEAVIQAMPTQHDLASQVGATRETVARALGQLINTGVIKRQGRTLLIRDHEMLSVMADPDADGGAALKPV